jgi:linoleoyl-CoA desaturase
MMVVAAGVTLSVVFQLAHVVEETHFADVRENPSFESPVEWAIHQVRTTANFATKSRFITWFLGGLNFQIEHHLFPKVSHVHYPDISKIVREVCDEFQVTYNDLGSFASAFQSHVRQLKNMGQMAAVS